MGRPRKTPTTTTSNQIRADGGHGVPIVELSGPLFTAEDVAELFVGVELQPSADLDRCAQLLDLAVRWAITAQNQAASHMAMNEERDYFVKIHSTATDLLRMLGVAHVAEDLADYDMTTLANFAGLIRYAQHPVITALDLTKAEQERIAQSILELPTTLSYIIALAAHCAEERGKRSRRGRGADVFADRFYWALLPVWQTTFGRFPRTRDKIGAPIESVASVVWGIAEHAMHRLMAMEGPRHPAIASLHSIATSNPRSVADAIEDARRAYEAAGMSAARMLETPT
jgi:hypothetical protein